VCFLLATGCSEKKQPEQKPQVSVDEGLSPEAKSLLVKSWPKIKKVCPGLVKYGKELRLDGIEDHLKSQTGSYRKVTLNFVVPDKTGRIPKEYFASGHHCALDISEDGKKLSIAERPCIAVCLDKPFQGTAPDTGDELILDLP
jgi:hypothetical protein